MDQLLLVFSGVVLILTLAGAEQGQGGVFTECSVDLQHCVFEDNILNIINNVPSLEECRLACKAEKDCRYITYYDTDYALREPFAGSCILFSHCSLFPPYAGDNRCQGCVTEDLQCNAVVEPCSAPVQGQLGNNLINIVTGIHSEGECREICQAESQCNFYTYHTTQDQSYPSTCFLLTTLQEPLSYAYFDVTSHFSTGTKNCDTNSEGGCFVMTAGWETIDSALMFSEVYDYQAVVVGTCSLTAVAVGGGGEDGGGSGYIVWDQISVNGSLVVDVKVGGPAQNTEVSVPQLWGGYGGLGGTTIVQAEAGSSDNGDGYCGGGGVGYAGHPGGDGGYDGGDGQSGPGSSVAPAPGGDGSGLKVADIPVTKYILSPGMGGRGGDRGGGGGGLLVDGEGPTVLDLTDGEGYGAGAGDRQKGKPGLVIIECN